MKMGRHKSLWLLLCLTGCATLHTTSAPTIEVELGLRYLEQGQVERGALHLTRALKRAPTEVATLDAYAYYLEVVGEIKRSEFYYQKALQLHPHSAIAHNNYGTFLCRHQHYHAAIKEFLMAIHTVGYRDVARANENAGICARLAKDKTQAAFYFHEALQHNPHLVLSQQEVHP